jgi:YceG-like family
VTDVEGSDWVRPTARRAAPPDAGANAGAAPEGVPAPRRTRAETQAARQAAKGRQSSRTNRGARSAAPPQPAAPPAVPAWHEEPTQPQPAVRVERGSRRGDGGGGSSRGGGGGGGGGNGSSPGGGASQADRRRNRRVALVLGVLILPFVAAAVWLVVQIAPSGGPVKTTPPSAPAGQLKLLLRPGLNLSQIGDVIATLPGHTKAGFVATANSGTIRSQYQPATVKTPEGVLFPDTYFVLGNESDSSILRRLVSRFDQIGDGIGLGSTTALSPYQTIIVASLIQQEAKLSSDAALVSAVIYNRIKAHMPLQIDATLCYAKGGCPPVPTATDKKINSPYNTYLVAGLPPTPIASVSEASLQAAMQPANVPYVYYVIADSTGKLAFATTLPQQNANIAAAHRKGLL